MSFSKPKFFKQTRGDGSEYFLACVDYKTRWFFGLLSFTETLWCNIGKGDDFFLTSSYPDKFKTLEDAKRGIHIAMIAKSAEDLHETVVSVEEII